MPTAATVFQAEIIGIKLAYKEMVALNNETPVKYMKLFSDSQAAVAAIDSREVTYQEVWDAKKALNTLVQVTNHIFLVWIKAHMGHEGNKAADKLAKQGTTPTNFINLGMPA